MFGFFMFAQPMFGDIPIISIGHSGGGGSGAPRPNPFVKRNVENQIETLIISFLNTQN